jgi:hypothetical protein
LGSAVELGSCKSLFTAQISLNLSNKFPVPLRRLQLECRRFVHVSAFAIAKRSTMRKAKVALARRLAIIMHAMLRDGTEFDLA